MFVNYSFSLIILREEVKDFIDKNICSPISSLLVSYSICNIIKFLSVIYFLLNGVETVLKRFF